ncbi:MAG: ABC transporter ATP-binding protein [Bacteroidota bacterium]|nr:ABC transporter ATP-binding protein [Bacteroidota bacterium]
MIEIKDLSFGYNKNKLLYKNLNLTLENGCIYGLLGKNGAGKSTLLKNIIGLLFPNSGEISVNGFKPKKRLPGFLESIYFIPEEVDVPPLSIKRYLNLFTPFYPKFDEKLFYEYLNDLEIESNIKLSSLSLGQQKKFIIAFALASNTQVLIMDEPTNGLDIPSKSWLRKLIASIVNEDRIIIISTHQVRDLDNLIDRVIVVDEGNLLLHASMFDIAQRLCFKTVTEANINEQVFYSEESMKGYSIVTKNTLQEDSKVNLEHLFNAVTRYGNEVKTLFNNV